MKNYICKCEVCKAERAERRAAQAARVAAALEATNARAANRELGSRVRELAQRHLDAEWASADGRITRVQAMSPAHLCYALAKCYRGEVSWHATRSQEVLESELLRRLAGVAGTDRQQAAQRSLAWGRG